MISKLGNRNENTELRGDDGEASHIPFLCMFFVTEAKHIGFLSFLVIASRDGLKSSGVSSSLHSVP